MRREETASIRLSDLWLQWYTSGLSREQRDDRRSEIASDSAEHATYRGEQGWTDRQIGRERLTRTLMGSAADLRWRRDVLVRSRGQESDGPIQAALTWLRWEWLTVAGLALGGFYLTFALYVAGVGGLENVPFVSWFGLDDLSGRTIGAFVIGTLGVVAVAASFARLLGSKSASLTLAGVAAPALPFFWMILPSALSVAVLFGSALELGRGLSEASQEGQEE